GGELQRVDEDADHHPPLVADAATGLADQAGVPRVQRPHGGDVADPADLAAGGAEPLNHTDELLATAREVDLRGHREALPSPFGTSGRRGSPGVGLSRREAASSSSRIRAARIGSTRPSVTTRPSVARPSAT